jgi:hypothetical protein
MSQVVVRRLSVIVVSVLVVVTGWVIVSSRATAASSTPVVYVATGENFPDALGASAAAAVQDGPVLLVRKSSIPSVTAAELSRLNPDVIFVVGGTAVITDTVVSQLGTYASTVTRVAGPDRYATAAAVSAAVFPIAGGGGGALEARVVALEAQVDALQALLAGVTRNGDTLILSGMNLQVVNGQGTTTTSNGLGNVIIGYNEDMGSQEPRTGSHYLIVGDEHTWTSYGGIVAGYQNTAGGAFGSVTGGHFNIASGDYSSVTGGYSNIASAEYSSMTGGRFNTASGWASSVFGGQYNDAEGTRSTVTGGLDNTASGDYSSVSGGWGNTAGGQYASVSGGNLNSAGGESSSVSGGWWNFATGNYSSVLGGSHETVTSSYGTYPDGP